MLVKKEQVTNAHKVPNTSGNYTISAKVGRLNVRFELIPLYEIATFHLSISTHGNEFLGIADTDVEYLPITHKEVRALWDYLVDSAEANALITRNDAMSQIKGMLND